MEQNRDLRQQVEGYETSLMNLSEGKEPFIGNKENGGTAVSKDIPIPSKNARHFLPSVRVYTTHGSSTRAEIYRIA